MKILFWIGLILMILGLASFFVAIPSSDRNGITVGGVSMEVETSRQEKLPPLVSSLIIVSGAAMMIVARRKG